MAFQPIMWGGDHGFGPYAIVPLLYHSLLRALDFWTIPEFAVVECILLAALKRDCIGLAACSAGEALNRVHSPRSGRQQCMAAPKDCACSPNPPAICVGLKHVSLHMRD